MKCVQRNRKGLKNSPEQEIAVVVKQGWYDVAEMARHDVAQKVAH